MESVPDRNQDNSAVPLDPRRLRRGLRQYLEDMQRAGIQHVLWPSSSDVDLPVLIQQPQANSSGASRESGLSEGEPSDSVISGRPISPVSSVDEVTPTGGTQPLVQTREDALAELAQQVAQCTLCPELVQNRTQTVFGVGNPYSELVFIGEAPGVDEDKQGFPFVGRAGQLLTAMITNGMGMRREDVYICNILRCRPPNNRTPTKDEADRCRPWLDATLAVIQPKYICCLGNVAAQNLLKTEAGIGKLRGKVWEYNQAKVVCTYHPAFLLRNPTMKREAWEDLKLLLQTMGRPIPRRSS